MSHMHYLPLAPGFFAILVGLFLIVLILRSVRYAYESLGVSSNTAIFLLLATLIGSFFNIPITELAPERAMSHHHVDFFGMRYAVPNERHWMFDENSVSYKRRLVTDASRDAYGFHRPGYRVLVDAPTTDAIDEAYRNYLDGLTSAWKGKRSTDDCR